MSVRTVPKNYRNLTGRSASQKAEEAFFESTLERDFLTLLEFDNHVMSYDVQPVKIAWENHDGKPRQYTPDVLIEYTPNSCPFSSHQIILVEVKYRDDLRKNWAEYKPKFKAAIRYAKEHGWRFKIMTEHEIRTDYMLNARFLLTYLRMENVLIQEFEKRLIETLAKQKRCSIKLLLSSIFSNRWEQAELLPTLWFLIGIGRIQADLTNPLTMTSDVWVRG